jgi:protein-S-isoprenylcysteine O-methyltransferase Ste14
VTQPSGANTGAPGAPGATPAVSAAEQTRAARAGAVLFRNRSWLPVPFLLVPLLAPGHMTRSGWVVGAVLIVVGELTRFLGVAAAGAVTRRRSREVQRLVTYGIFGWVRNPLYIGNALIWCGFLVGSGVFWFLPVALVLFAVEYSLIVRYEEGVLQSIFGSTYADYQLRTPRWLPNRPRHPESGPHFWAEAARSETSTIAQFVALAVAFYIKARITS